MRKQDPVTNYLLQDWRRNRRTGMREKTRMVKIPLSVMQQVKDHCTANDLAQGRFIEEALRWYLVTQVQGGIYRKGTVEEHQEPFETSSLGLGSTLDPKRNSFSVQGEL